MNVVGQKIKLDQLTGLRYFAALLVFFSHLKWDNAPSALQIVFEQGYVGVSFFFVLSGFVLSYSYGDKVRSGALSLKTYVLLRLARLSPLHFITAAPFVLLGLYQGNLDWLKTLLNLLYLHSWAPIASFYFSLNAPSWSLSNEMFFYLCFFPLVLLPTRSQLRIALGLLAMVVLAACLVYWRLDEHKLFGHQTFAHWLFYIFPGFRLLEFIIGMVLYGFWKDGWRIQPFCLAPSYLLLVVAMYFAHLIPEPFRFSLWFLPVIVLFFYAHLDEDGLATRFYSHRTLVLLGNASFAFYLIHQPLIQVFTRVLASLKLSNWGFCLVAWLAISALSVAAYLLYEKPAESFLKSRIRKAA